MPAKTFSVRIGGHVLLLHGGEHGLELTSIAGGTQETVTITDQGLLTDMMRALNAARRTKEVE